MINGLIITSENTLFEEFNELLSSEKNYFEYAENEDSAKEYLKVEIPDLILIAQKSVEEIQQVLQMIHENERLKYIPVVCFMGKSSWIDREVLWKYNVIDIVQLPVLNQELKLLFERIISNFSFENNRQQEAGMQGRLEDYNLIDLVQTLDQNKKTGVLHLKREKQQGRIWFFEGKIFKAEYRKFRNVDAILNLMTWLDGHFSITFVDEEYEREIQLDNEQILIESIQRIDQRNKILKTLPDRFKTLLISPAADMDKMPDEDVRLLKFFQGGNSIAAFSWYFEDDEIYLLEKAKEFIEKKLLLSRSKFDAFKLEIEDEVENVGFKNKLKKIFSKKEKATLSKDRRMDDTQVGINIADDTQMSKTDEVFDNLINLETGELERFKLKIEKL